VIHIRSVDSLRDSRRERGTCATFFLPLQLPSEYSITVPVLVLRHIPLLTSEVPRRFPQTHNYLTQMRVPQFEFSIRVCQPSREYGERHPVCVSAVDRPTRLRSIPRTALADTAADRKQRPYIVALAAGRYWPGPKVAGNSQLRPNTVDAVMGDPGDGPDSASPTASQLFGEYLNSRLPEIDPTAFCRPAGKSTPIGTPPVSPGSLVELKRTLVDLARPRDRSVCRQCACSRRRGSCEPRRSTAH
jgi:hypothetical protein